ncbi:MAG TPA: hypothetical protein EYP46_00950 [Hadesarchaea archaeon]|nr:hypothetical protein [Hadesarchaea archaeon]
MLAPLLLAILSGIFFGSWSVSLKKARNYKFENFFLMLVLVTLAVVSASTLVLEGPGIFGQVMAAGLNPVAWGLGGGVFWGLATLSFGYALTLVGLALGYAIILGLGMFVGTSVSMFLMAGLPADVGSVVRVYAMVGVFVALTGTVMSSYAGHLKLKRVARGRERRDFKKGIPICVLSGFLGSFFALGYAGAHEQLSTWSSIFLLVLGFSLVQIVILGVKITRSANWRAYKNLKHNVLYPLAGGLTFGPAVVFHFASANEVGVALAYPLMMGIQILSGNLWSFLGFGEWRQAPRNAKTIQIIALTILMVASILIGRAMGFVG